MAFVRYWIENPERFQLVFMPEGVEWTDVSDFLKEDSVVGCFEVFRSHFREKSQIATSDAIADEETRIASLIGIALCNITIRDHPWPVPRVIVKTLVSSATR